MLKKILTLLAVCSMGITAAFAQSDNDDFAGNWVRAVPFTQHNYAFNSGLYSPHLLFAAYSANAGFVAGNNAQLRVSLPTNNYPGAAIGSRTAFTVGYDRSFLEKKIGAGAFLTYDAGINTYAVSFGLGGNYGLVFSDEHELRLGAGFQLDYAKMNFGLDPFIPSFSGTYSLTSFQYNLSAWYRFKGLQAGLAFRNMGEPNFYYRYEDGTSSNFPIHTRFQTALHLSYALPIGDNLHILPRFDMQLIKGTATTFGIMPQGVYKNKFMLGGGVFIDHINGGGSTLVERGVICAGFRVWKLQLEYALNLNNETAWNGKKEFWTNHQIGLRANF